MNNHKFYIDIVKSDAITIRHKPDRVVIAIENTNENVGLSLPELEQLAEQVVKGLNNEIDKDLAKALIMCRNVIRTTMEKGQLPDYVGEVAIEQAETAIKKSERK